MYLGDSKLGLGMDILYDKIEKMEIEAVDRFSSWFGYHLSNTDYKWPWHAWYYINIELTL